VRESTHEHLRWLTLHEEVKQQHAEGDPALFNTCSSSGLPRAERIVRKSSPIGIANSAMPSRLLAMHFCSRLCFRLCHRRVAAGDHTGPRRWLNCAFGTSMVPAFRTVACGDGVGLTWGPPWTVFGSSGAPTFRTIALGENGGALDCVVGEPAREKITAALAVAPTAQATSVTKSVRRVSPRASAHSE
jgi:hypothetical protein